MEYRLPPLLAWLLSLPLVNRLGFARRPKEFVRFLKFATVGMTGMVVDLTVLNVMHKFFGLPLLVANTISFTTAVISNFTWNRLWTFPESRERPLGSQLRQVHAGQRDRSCHQQSGPMAGFSGDAADRPGPLGL